MGSQKKQDKALVLFIAAEPRGLSPIRLASEFQKVVNEVERKNGPIEFRTVWAARPLDVTRALSDYEPAVVHFSGHGTKNGGLLLESANGSPQEIDVEGMGAIFNEFRKKIRVVVLNSCYSRQLAREIAKSVEVVVGMDDAIGVEGAIEFSVGFYRALAAGESVQRCFNQAITEIKANTIPEGHIPKLFTRPGVEAWEVKLVAREGRAATAYADDRPTAVIRKSLMEDVEARGTVSATGHDESVMRRVKSERDVYNKARRDR